MAKRTSFFKTTAIGGLLFLLPLVVVGALIGQVVPVVLTVVESLGELVPVHRPSGIALPLMLSIAILLALCFIAGPLARRSVGKRLATWFERNLLLFRRYAIVRNGMPGSVGGTETAPRLQAVVLRFDDVVRIGFETERHDSGTVTVYSPGAPDP